MLTIMKSSLNGTHCVQSAKTKESNIDQTLKSERESHPLYESEGRTLARRYCGTYPWYSTSHALHTHIYRSGVSADLLLAVFCTIRTIFLFNTLLKMCDVLLKNIHQLIEISI